MLQRWRRIRDRVVIGSGVGARKKVRPGRGAFGGMFMSEIYRTIVVVMVVVVVVIVLVAVGAAVVTVEQDDRREVCNAGSTDDVSHQVEVKSPDARTSREAFEKLFVLTVCLLGGEINRIVPPGWGPGSLNEKVQNEAVDWRIGEPGWTPVRNRWVQGLEKGRLRRCGWGRKEPRQGFF